MDVGVGIIIIIPLRVVRSMTTFWQPQMEDKKEKEKWMTNVAFCLVLDLTMYKQEYAMGIRSLCCTELWRLRLGNM